MRRRFLWEKTMMMKNKAFIKLYRNVLTKPEMTDLVAQHGAEGFGVYVMLMVYLAQCDDFEGAFTNGLLTQIAVQAHKSRKFVRHIACDFHLFEITGNRFRIASEIWSQILSGCPADTCSLVKSFILFFPPLRFRVPLQSRKSL